MSRIHDMSERAGAEQKKHTSKRSYLGNTAHVLERVCVCACVVGWMDTSDRGETQGDRTQCLSCRDGQHPERREVGQIAFCSVRRKCFLSLLHSCCQEMR